MAAIPTCLTLIRVSAPQSLGRNRSSFAGLGSGKVSGVWFPGSHTLGSLPMGPVHGDLFDNNVLVDSGGRLAGIVDFHVSGDEVFVNELAGTAAVLCYGSEVEGNLSGRQLLELYIAAYET